MIFKYEEYEVKRKPPGSIPVVPALKVYATVTSRMIHFLSVTKHLIYNLECLLENAANKCFTITLRHKNAVL